MISAKAIQIGKDIDIARCNGNWIAIAELARRYRKYNSEGAGKFQKKKDKSRLFVAKMLQLSFGTNCVSRNKLGSDTQYDTFKSNY